jgi:hypothetical protein
MKQKTSQAMRCESCGASQFKRSQQHGLLVCQYCGTQQAQGVTEHKQSGGAPGKPMMSWILVLSTAVVLLIGVVRYQSSRPEVQPLSIGDTALTSEPTKPATVTPQPIAVVKPNPQDQPEVQTQSVNEHLKAVHQVTGETSNGGRYWVFTLENTSADTVYKPHVMVSLFDETGQRVAEQAGWSYQHRLEPGSQTQVLVFMSEPPGGKTTEQITTLGSLNGHYVAEQYGLTISDFKVSTKHSQYELVGDVLNEHELEVKFPRVVVVALDESGRAIGLGQTFTTLKALSPGQDSGFKVRVGTFLSGEPASWQVYALAQKS